MSPTIRSKGGLPLMIGGLVAGADECCCENPPPPFCWECADLCSYVMNVTEPTELPASGRIVCGEGAADGATRTTFMFPGILPSGFEDYPYVTDGSFYGGQWNGSRGEAWISPWPFGPYAFVQHWRRGDVDDAPVAEGCATSSGFELQGSVSVGISCEPGRTPTPYTVRVSADVSCALFAASDEKSGSECGGVWRWFGWSVFDLNSSCITAPKRTCNDYLNQMRHLTTPVLITADAAGTSLGAYQNENTFTSGGMGSWCQGFGEALRDELSATFRITSRPNCLPPVACDCNVPLGGLAIESWTIGRWNLGGDFDNGCGTYQLQSGNQFAIRVDDGVPDGGGGCLPTESIRQLDIYCQSVDGVPTWFVLIRTTCFQRNAGVLTHQATDTWLGKFLCYQQECDDTENGRFAGDSIPQGEPVDIEYLGREVGFGLQECTPPGLFDFRLIQDAVVC